MTEEYKRFHYFNTDTLFTFLIISSFRSFVHWTSIYTSHIYTNTHVHINTHKGATIVRGSLTGLVFDKSLRVSSNEDFQKSPSSGDSDDKKSGEKKSSPSVGSSSVLNLMQSDVLIIENAALQIHTIWDGLLQISIYSALLYSYLGSSVIWGIGILLLTIPINSLTLRVLNRLSKDELEAKDNRTKKTAEAITNMKILKLQGWENHFEKGIEIARSEELRRHVKRGAFRALNQAISNAVPAIVLVVTLTAYRRTGKPIVASTIFTAISLFNQLRFPLLFYPMVIDALANGKNALSRLSSYLCQEDLTPYVKKLPMVNGNGGCIDLSNGNFFWSKPTSASHENDNRTGASPALCGADIHVKAGEVACVVGNVGSGKSALIKAMLGELEPVPRIAVDDSVGKSVAPPADSLVNNIPIVKIRGDVAYCSQESWLSKGTIQEAVLFGREYDEARYLSAIYDAGLDEDVASGTLSHNTEVGEGGFSLSGGQRARVQIARAMYGDNIGVYLLDDPLSALDASVGSTVFERITNRTRERGAATVFVTNDASLPRRCDKVFIMEKVSNGSHSCSRIVDSGTYDEIISRGRNLSNTTIHPEISESEPKEEGLQSDKIVRANLKETETAVKKKKDDKKIQDERKEVSSKQKTLDDMMTDGAVPRSTYITYLKAVRNPVLILGALSCYLLSNGAQFFQQFTVAKWTELGHDTALSVALGGKYLQSLVYAAGVVSVFLWLRSYLLMRTGTRASEFIHSKMLSSVFRAPVTFFDATPSGQLLSRFGNELETVDRGVPDGIGSFLFCFLNIAITAAGLTGLMTPGMAVPIILVSYFYNCVMAQFRPAARDLKRFESKSRSPIYTTFGEALTGAETIRSIGNSSTLWKSEIRRLVDQNLTVIYSVKGLDRWLSVRLESLGNVLVLIASFASIFLTRSGKLKAGSAGWGLTQALAITGLLTWTVRVLTDLETQMMSVMRVNEVASFDTNSSDSQHAIPQEKYKPGEALQDLFHPNNSLSTSPTTDSALMKSGWPWQGGITFKHVSVRYNPSSPRALKDINLDVPPGTTLGVVGRTGSGKSTLLLTLFRLVEIESEGTIEIDGVDIRSIGIQSLRDSLAIIPQEPTLFSGTLMYNLDATGNSSREDAWNALRAASPELAREYHKSPEGLDTQIAEGGKNLSSGQRQLVCLARALLRKSKILVLDEATSSVDPKTDEQVQATIRREFVEKGVSVITVAHRLDTVINSDKIAVMGAGALIEYGTPKQLLSTRDGHFRRLVDADTQNKVKGGASVSKSATVIQS